jgi:hypothetical protein
MKKSILVFFAMIIFAGMALEAQQPANQAPRVNLKPKFFVEDVVFMGNALNTIELTGAEIESFIQVKNFFKTAIKDIQDNKRSPSDLVEYSMDIESAKIMVKFLERAKFSGSQAEKYKRFIDAIVESVNVLKKPAPAPDGK